MVLFVGAVMASSLPPLSWQVVNDTVMGGVSKGRTLELDEGEVRFVGELSLEQNGGFVSIRTRPQPLSLQGVEAFDVAIRGEGRTWTLNLYREDVPLRAGSYRVEIPTEAEGITQVRVPLADFEPRSFGRPVVGAPALDAGPEHITALGFLLADKRAGPFALDVISVVPTGEARTRGEGVEGVRLGLQKAVNDGVPTFNNGDVVGCRDLYKEALQRIRSSSALTAGEQRLVGRALDAAAGQKPEAAAWTLRHAIDSVLASGGR